MLDLGQQQPSDIATGSSGKFATRLLELADDLLPSRWPGYPKERAAAVRALLARFGETLAS